MAFCYLGTLDDGHSDHHSRHTSTHVRWVRCVRFQAFRRFGLDRSVDDFDFARLTVEFKENGSGSIGASFTNRQKLDDQTFSWFDVDVKFFTDGWAKKKTEVGNKETSP